MERVMVVNFKTASGAHYCMDRTNMTWERYHASVTIHNLPNDNNYSRNVSNHGILTEWPAIILGARVMFNDTKVGVIYTTPIISGYTDRP
jgi:hypothetical protein